MLDKPSILVFEPDREAKLGSQRMPTLSVLQRGVRYSRARLKVESSPFAADNFRIPRSGSAGEPSPSVVVEGRIVG